MTEPDHPTLSPSLISKLKAMDLDSLAEMLGVGRPGDGLLDPDFRLISVDEARVMPDVIEPPRVEPVWPVPPVAQPEDEVYAILAYSRERHERTIYTFFATADFANLAVPISLLDFGYLPDPVLKQWHWWRGPGADALGTPEAVKKLAQAIVDKAKGVKYDPDNPKALDERFEIKTAKATHTFMTRKGWRGLWAPLAMKPEGHPDDRCATFTKIFTEDQIKGRRSIMRYARRMAREHDKIRIRPKLPGGARYPYKALYLSQLHQDKLEAIRAWMAASNPNGCSRSKVIRNLIDDQHDRLPPESEWVFRAYPWRIEDITPKPDRSSMRLLKRHERAVSRTDGKPISERQQQVLTVASQIAGPSGPVSPMDIAKRIGVTPNNVTLVIRQLKKDGLWSHPALAAGRRRKGQDAPVVKNPTYEDERTAAREIMDRLSRLADPESRLRVLEMIEIDPEEKRDDEQGGRPWIFQTRGPD
jgi:hypothetical protein